ncbi:hypothetical protein [Sorangium sp. So ce1099]|uniref:hypothetical protein n=1 Tax=Sorangium sp. So ce1099 TaxID=3133331 RepID=UPI003F60B3FF
MKSTGRTNSNAVDNASPPRSGGALGEGGAQARRAPQRRRIGILFTSCVVPAASAVAALHLAGCWPLSYSERCEDDARYCTPDETSGGGGTTQPDPTCAADPTQDPSTVRDQCAVFARAGAAAGGDGTKARPYASLSEAIESAKGKRVLACSIGAFEESVTVAVAAEVIGGFDCNADWAWSTEAQSTIEGDANKAALTLTKGASGAKLRSFKIVAADATVAGGSSIGVAADDIEAELSSVAVVAGNGMDGAKGETSTAAQDGASAPNDVSNACVTPIYGGLPGVTTCEDGEATSGGVGGLGGKPETDGGNGQKGQDGTPLPAENPDGSGLGGAGQLVSQASCARGEDGALGAYGNPGDRGADTALTLAGPTGGHGLSGTSGARGQGGGGGGGARAGEFCAAGGGTYDDGPGASGGGGGAGGCGGKAGTGGKAGGSSIGILSLGTKLVLTDVTVTVGKAGNGGMGGDGSPGGLGGMGASGGARVSVSGSIQGCAGGRGGAGGDGGPGGGGRGGHAVGIAYATAPSQAPALNVTEGTAGDGGVAGRGGPDTSDGAPGERGACWDFGAKQACPQT